MFFGRKHRQLLALALLIASLFAQGAIAASGCLMPGATLSTVIAGASNPHCDSDMVNPNLCLLHSADQSDQSAPQPAIGTPALAVPILALKSGDVADVQRVRCAPVQPAGIDPAIPIRFCKFLN